MRKLYLILTMAMTITTGLATVASATPVYVTGNECPNDPLPAEFDRQYTVTQATNCMFDAAVSNVQGTTAEADLWLNTAPAPWGTGWVGLGKSDPGIAGFSYTVDGGNDDGTFTIGSLLTNQYGQFALAVKDGGTPKFAIFLLPAGTSGGDWHFSTDGGELSHFALFGRDPVEEQQNFPAAVPEPASIALLGAGLAFGARKLRRKN